ncbi:hypothetical protein YC2023_110216 [Brassica napus]
MEATSSGHGIPANPSMIPSCRPCSSKKIPKLSMATHELFSSSRQLIGSIIFAYKIKAMCFLFHRSKKKDTYEGVLQREDEFNVEHQISMNSRE